MSDLIRRQDAIDVIAKSYCYESERMTALQNVPAVEVVPVVHGEWENVGDNEEDLCFRCTNCKAEFSCEIDMKQFAKHCPECGAKMKGGA